MKYAILSGLILIGLLTGCANITPVYDSSGNIMSITSSKFMADLTFEQAIEYSADGKTILKRAMKMETKTNADRILGEVVKGAGVLVDGTGKLMP